MLFGASNIHDITVHTKTVYDKQLYVYLLWKLSINV
jgi:hypothetical protein